MFPVPGSFCPFRCPAPICNDSVEQITKIRESQSPKYPFAHFLTHNSCHILQRYHFRCFSAVHTPTQWNMICTFKVKCETGFLINTPGLQHDCCAISNSKVHENLGMVPSPFAVHSHFSTRYRKRYWKKELFDEVGAITNTVSQIYGDSVKLAGASFRWLYHHSLLDGKYGGTEILIFLVFAFLVIKNCLHC